MPNAHDDATQVGMAIARLAGVKLTPEAGKAGMCMLQATIACAPMFLQAFAACMMDQPVPPTKP